MIRLLDLIGESALRTFRSHEQFPRAVEIVASGAVAHFAQLPRSLQLILRDVGAACIGLVALGLQRTDDGLTIARLTATCEEKQLASRGRVQAFVNTCLRNDELVFLEQSGARTRCQLAIRPALIAAYRGRARVEFDGLVAVVPAMRAYLHLLDDDGAFLEIMTWVLRLSSERPDILLNHASNPAMELFVYRDGGMLMLYDLLIAQDSDRTRLLETAPLSRYALAKRYGLSRLHVARMLKEAQDHGLMSFPTPARVVFSEQMSRGLELQSAQLLQWLRASVLATAGQLTVDAPPGAHSSIRRAPHND